MDRFDKITYYFIAFVFLGCGLLSFYRSSLTDTDLIRLSGRLDNVEIVELISFNSKGGKNHTYPIVLDIEGDNMRHGFYFSSKERAKETLNKLKLIVGNNYTILYDPTVGKSFGSNVKLGIKKIKQNNKTILEETNLKNKVLGYFMVGLSIILFLVLLNTDKIKKRFANKHSITNAGSGQ